MPQKHFNPIMNPDYDNRGQIDGVGGDEV